MLICAFKGSPAEGGETLGVLDGIGTVAPHLAAVVAGGGPAKTNELCQNQEDVQAKKETRKDLKEQLQRKQEELDTFGDAELHPNPLHDADKCSLPSATRVI